MKLKIGSILLRKSKWIGLFLWVSLISTTTFSSSQLVQLKNNQVKTIFVEKKDNYYVTEGDIVVPFSKGDNKGAVVIPELGGVRWPDAIVPFTLDRSLPGANIDYIYQAMMDIEFATSIKFIEVTDTRQHEDYLYFTPSSGCASYVGRQGGVQNVWIASWCHKGSTTHEIMHALGFWHEQSRSDRDNYVQIMWNNIVEEQKHNFYQHINDGDDVYEYDYDSIMHYGSKAFSKNGYDTIVPYDRSKRIGNRSHMSDTDIMAINKLYGAESPCLSLMAKKALYKKIRTG